MHGFLRRSRSSNCLHVYALYSMLAQRRKH
jgi:hypothetical protein